MKTDIQIAHEATLRPIGQIAAALGIAENEYEPYGHTKAKLNQQLFNRVQGNPTGKLVLVTAVNPTPAGEGKTTITVGLGQAMAKIGKNAIIALREPSLGPVFGVKGGAAGGGYSQVIPMEDINLHFTGDFHAITAANNLICAALDNHLHQGNTLNIDPRRVIIKRAVDMNDRALRSITIGLGGVANGIPRQDGFYITVASEIMAILCLAENLPDLKQRIGNMLVAYTYGRQPVYVRDLQVAGAAAALLKDAINPNLVQTLEGTPAMIHGGPFANIAHGCNSVRATKLGLKLCDYCITEAGFGSDLGAEKFFDIKCRMAGLTPNACVVVVTARALKYNGGVAKEDLTKEDIPALRRGLPNLVAHVQNMQKYGMPVVVAINHFFADTPGELAAIGDCLKQLGVPYCISRAFEDGGEGSIALANLVVQACDTPGNFAPLYPVEDSIADKIAAIAKNIYGASGVTFSPAAKTAMRQIEALGRDKLPVCIAKTQYSLSDNPKLLCRPTDFTISINQITLNNGAGFIVAQAGNIMVMPGLPKAPAAWQIDVTDEGEITGIF